MIRRIRIAELTEPMVEQLTSPAGLPCAQYTIRARQAGLSGRYEIFVDGAPMRSGLTAAGMKRVAAALRHAFLTEWM